MDLVLEHITEDRIPRWLGPACIEEVEGRVINPEPVTVVLSGDFVRSVGLRRDEDRYEYTTERTFGETVAKTMFGADGIAILFDVPLITREHVPEDYLRRMAGHEAYHAVIHERGESSHAIRERHDLGALTEQGTFGELATYAVEEYRVERALCDEGLPMHALTRDGMSDVLDSFRLRLRSAVITDKELMWTVQTVLTAFHHVSMYLAYRAADELTGGPVPPVTADWTRLVGSGYDSFKNALSAIPTAREPIAFTEFDPLIFAVGRAMQDWLAYLGFTIEDQVGGGYYFDILRHDF